MNNKAIWDVFNRFRGIIDMTTFTDVMAYTLLLKKIEISGPDYYRSDYSVKYLSRLYGDVILEDELCQYLGEIEKNNNVPNGILADSFRSMIRRFGAEKELRILLDIFRSVSEIDFKTENDVSEAFDIFLETIVRHIGRVWSDIYTTKSVARLESVLLDIDEYSGEIYDPFCGSGITIVTAAQNNNSLSARDISMKKVAIATINMIIHGCKIAEVVCGDSLFALNNTYDRIVSEPPLGYGYSETSYSELRNLKNFISKDTLMVERIIDSLSENGKAVVMVPIVALFGGGKTTEFRRKIVDDGILEGVVLLPSGALCGTSVNTALLVINKCRKERNIFMMDTTSLWEKKSIREIYLSDDNIRDIGRIFSRKEQVEGVSIVVDLESLEDNEFNLTPTMYISPYTIEKIELKDVTELLQKQKNLEEELDRVSAELYSIRQYN